MFVLAVFVVVLFTINNAECGNPEPDVHELLIALDNKLESQAAKIRHLEDTVSNQEKTIAELTEDVKSQVNDKKKLTEEINELKMKSVEHESIIKRLVKYSRQPTEEHGVAPKTKKRTKVNGIRKVDKSIDEKKRFVMDTLETVAFEATIADVKYLQHNNIHDMIVFDDVSLNVGNGYHSGNGTFVAPMSGIYIFSTSVLMHGASTQDLNMHIILEKNNAEIAGAFAFNQGVYEHCSVTATMDLKVGDMVAVTVERHNDISFYGDKLTSFTGFLLFPY